ncbi:hypothetical protein ACFLWC_06480 [Chloroflexota bacterium]
MDEINHLKQDRQEGKRELNRLNEANERLAKLTGAEVKLSDFYNKVKKNLDVCTFEDKRLALEMLDIKVSATLECIDITGTIPIEIIATQSSSSLPTTGQTSGCLRRRRISLTFRQNVT